MKISNTICKLEPLSQRKTTKIKQIDPSLLYYYMTDAETRMKRLEKLRHFEMEVFDRNMKKKRYALTCNSHSSKELKDNGIEASKRIKREDSIKNSSGKSTHPKAEIIDLVEEEENDILERLTPPLPGVKRPINFFVVIDDSTAELKEKEDEDLFERSTPPLPEKKTNSRVIIDV